jgi:hypothetical protein
MKYFSLFAAIAILFSSCDKDEVVPEVVSVSFSGIVFDYHTELPVEGAHVRFDDRETNSFVEAYTDANGLYDVSVLIEKGYDITITQSDYIVFETYFLIYPNSDNYTDMNFDLRAPCFVNYHFESTDTSNYGISFWVDNEDDDLTYVLLVEEGMDTVIRKQYFAEQQFALRYTLITENKAEPVTREVTKAFELSPNEEINYIIEF